MGTRNSTLVYIGGDTKIAQYGQWDGYPTGQGTTIANFLKTMDLPKFKEQVKTLKSYDQKEIDKIYKEAGADGSGWINMEVADRVKAKYPELSRDIGAEILQYVHNGEVIKVVLQPDFKEDSLFCEYYYELDLDNETISVNGGKRYSFDEWTPELMKQLEQAEREEE